MKISIADFRPITLLNTSYKLVSKVLVSRLRPILHQIVGPFQNSFLAGRGTSDNILITQEVVHSLVNLKGRRGGMILKLDIHKAYDTVSWQFLHETLLLLDLPNVLIELVMFSIKHMTTSIVWNGEKLPDFHSGRGLRQGLSEPYLFILVMERLSNMIQDKVDSKVWCPIRISRRGPSISHLFFADDLMLFARASHDQMELIKHCINDFSDKAPRV